MNADLFNNDPNDSLPKHLGIEAVEIRSGYSQLRLPLVSSLFALNGFLHAGSVVTLADTAAGTGCMASLPEAAESFTTIELKSNFTGTSRSGAVVATAKLLHGGRQTQVWDAVVTDEESGKPIAHFRCTQMILYPRK